MVAPGVKREAVAHVVEVHRVSQRRACKALALDRSSVRYRCVRPDDAEARAATKAVAAGISVSNTPGTNATSVAEHVFGMILSLRRSLCAMDAGVRAGQWSELRSAAPLHRDLAGGCLGVIGFGNIGRRVAEIGHFGFGMRPLILARSGRPVPDWCASGDLGAVLGESDVLVLCCPLTSETRGLIDGTALSRMRPEAVLVNVARGAVVEEAALAEALRSGRLGGAALDVHATQPLPASSPLRATPRTLLSPHVAGVSAEAMRGMSRLAVDDALVVLSGGTAVHRIGG